MTAPRTRPWRRTPRAKRWLLTLARRLMLALALPPLILAGCVTQTPIAETKPVQTDSGCVAFARITFDRLHDTTDTIAQVKAYDAARDAVCGKGK